MLVAVVYPVYDGREVLGRAFRILFRFSTEKESTNTVDEGSTTVRIGTKKKITEGQSSDNSSNISHQPL
jgi:hypothetical protein